jgi:hypothetical protein
MAHEAFRKTDEGTAGKPVLPPTFDADSGSRAAKSVGFKKAK